MSLSSYNAYINADDTENEKKRLKAAASKVWDFFEKLPCQQAKCKLCNKVMSHKPSGGTSHLKRHISLSCKKQFNPDIREQLYPTINKLPPSESTSILNSKYDAILNSKYDAVEFHKDNGAKIVDEQSITNLKHSVIATPVVTISPSPETPIQDARFITVKATYGDDIIRFELCSSSTMGDLEEEVAKRLKLKVGSFNIKYVDEDEDLVLITCDTDLWYCMRLLGGTTIKMVVRPLPFAH